MSKNQAVVVVQLVNFKDPKSCTITQNKLLMLVEIQQWNDTVPSRSISYWVHRPRYERCPVLFVFRDLSPLVLGFHNVFAARCRPIIVDAFLDMPNAGSQWLHTALGKAASSSCLAWSVLSLLFGGLLVQKVPNFPSHHASLKPCSSWINS